jgi:nucleoid-associated protein YgaU
MVEPGTYPDPDEPQALTPDAVYVPEAGEEIEEPSAVAAPMDESIVAAEPVDGAEPAVASPTAAARAWWIARAGGAALGAGGLRGLSLARAYPRATVATGLSVLVLCGGLSLKRGRAPVAEIPPPGKAPTAQPDDEGAGAPPPIGEEETIAAEPAPIHREEDPTAAPEPAPATSDNIRQAAADMGDLALPPEIDYPAEAAPEPADPLDAAPSPFGELLALNDPKPDGDAPPPAPAAEAPPPAPAAEAPPKPSPAQAPKADASAPPAPAPAAEPATDPGLPPEVSPSEPTAPEPAPAVDLPPAATPTEPTAPAPASEPPPVIAPEPAATAELPPPVVVPGPTPAAEPTPPSPSPSPAVPETVAAPPVLDHVEKAAPSAPADAPPAAPAAELPTFETAPASAPAPAPAPAPPTVPAEDDWVPIKHVAGPPKLDPRDMDLYDETFEGRAGRGGDFFADMVPSTPATPVQAAAPAVVAGAATGAAVAGAAAAIAAEAAPSRRDDGRMDTILHKVRAGENFWTISRTHYASGRYYKALGKANSDQFQRLQDLYVGAVIRIPPPEDLDPALIDPAGGDSARDRDPDAAEAPASQIASDAPRLRRSRGMNDEFNLPDADPETEQASDRDDRRRTPREEYDTPDPRRAPPVHKVRTRETLRSIARDRLGDSRRAREILELNRDGIPDPAHLTPGQVLDLPDDAQ